MLYLYLDESGDLGFDLGKEGTPRYFTICVLAVIGEEADKKLTKAVRKAMKAINYKKKNPINELKGTNTSLRYKKKFFDYIKDQPFQIHAVTLNKIRANEELKKTPDKVYNFISKLVLEQTPLGEAQSMIQLFVDKMKGSRQIRDFDQYLERMLQQEITDNVELHIHHLDSTKRKGIQAVDLFAYGINRKYEANDLSWYNIFKDKVGFETLYLP